MLLVSVQGAVIGGSRRRVRLVRGSAASVDVGAARTVRDRWSEPPFRTVTWCRVVGFGLVLRPVYAWPGFAVKDPLKQPRVRAGLTGPCNHELARERSCHASSSQRPPPSVHSPARRHPAPTGSGPAPTASGRKIRPIADPGSLALTPPAPRGRFSKNRVFRRVAASGTFDGRTLDERAAVARAETPCPAGFR
jgi:hypothetical protein